MRTITLWNHDWFFSKTASIPGQLPCGWEEVSLPHTWNATDGQDGGNDYYRGIGVYAKTFDFSEFVPGNRVIVELMNVMKVESRGRTKRAL